MDKRIRHVASERYSEKGEPLTARLSFFSKLWDLQAQIADDSLPMTLPDPEAARDALATGQPLFLVEAPRLDVETFRSAARRVVELVADEFGLSEDSADALRKAAIADTVTQEALDRAVQDFDAFAQAIATESGASEDGLVGAATVRFVLLSALTPLLRAQATALLEAVKGTDWRTWGSGLCPACGTPAASARVLDEGSLQGGHRVLSCPLCRAEWEFDRLRCVRCGSRSHPNLHYLVAEEDPGHRIHVCETCKGYIKVSFARDLEIAVVPEVEEIVMLPFDEVARERGYTELGRTDGKVAD